MKHIKLFEEFVNEAAEPKFVVHKGAAVMGYASSKVQARQNAKAQGAEYSTVEDYKEQYGDKFITEAAKSPSIEVIDNELFLDYTGTNKFGDLKSPVFKVEIGGPKNDPSNQRYLISWKEGGQAGWHWEAGNMKPSLKKSILSYAKKHLPFGVITEAAEPNIPNSEWEQSNQRAENGPWVCAKWKGKYYCAVGIMSPGGDLDYVEDVEEIDKDEYDSLMK